jgi:rRNA-processing protein EBP2
MVKSDAHMERIRQRLLDESATIKRSEEKRKEREGKKFGKQVQMEKLKERERSKKDMEERLKGLKRSVYLSLILELFLLSLCGILTYMFSAAFIERKGALDNAQEDEDGFDVAVEDAIADRPSKRARGNDAQKHRGGDKKRGLSRQARDSKFGFGSAGGHRSKQNTKSSTDDFEPRRGGGGGSGRGGRGGRGGARGAKSGGRGGAKRPGRGRRMASRGRA